MFSAKTNNFLNNKETLATSTVIVICLVLSIFFPSGNNIQYLIKQLFFMVIIPLLYIKFVLKKSVKEFGLNLQNKKTGIIWGILMLTTSLAIALLAVHYTAFSKNYLLSLLIKNNFWFFVLDMLVFFNFMLLTQEIFFRGFVLFSFSKKIDYYSVILQAALFFSTIFLIGGDFQKKFWTMFPFIVLSITGGITAYKSKSIVYSYIPGLIFLIILNSYLIKITQ